jgi:hypothetical protein
MILFLGQAKAFSYRTNFKLFSQFAFSICETACPEMIKNWQNGLPLPGVLLKIRKHGPRLGRRAQSIGERGCQALGPV